MRRLNRASFAGAAVLALGVLYLEYASNPLVRAVVTGVGATGAGLFVGTSIKLGRAIARRPAALVLVAGCFITVSVGRLSMLSVMPVAGSVYTGPPGTPFTDTAAYSGQPCPEPSRPAPTSP